MKFKVGDRVLCKKKLRGKNGTVFKKGGRYKIISNSQDIRVIDNVRYIEENIFNILGEYTIWGFNYKLEGKFSYNIFDYFYPIVEERRIKLEKLI